MSRPNKGDPLNYLRSMVSEGQTVIDGGANVGEFTKMFAERVGVTGKVYAIEPDPRCQEDLQGLVSRFPQIHVVEAALVASRHGTVPLTQSSDHKQSSLWPDAVTDYHATVSVPATTLDRITGEHVSAIKLDLQGGELDAFLGAERLLQTCPLWVIEVWPRVLQCRKFDGPRAWERMTASGLTPYWWQDHVVKTDRAEFCAVWEESGSFWNMVLMRE